MLVVAGNDVYATAFAVEVDLAVDQCEQRVIFALTDAFSGVELGAQLTDDDVAGDDFFAAETLHAAALTVGIATVAAGALTFFMCHGGFYLRAKPQTAMACHYGKNMRKNGTSVARLSYR